MSFPSTFSAFTRVAPTDRLNNPSHSALHNTVSSALGQVEAVIGVDGDNSVLGTIIGDLRSPGSGGGGHIQTANKGGTGQTSFTKGDILVASSASVLTKLSAGANGLSLRTDSTTATGLTYGSGNTFPTVRVYTNPSILTWSKPSTLSYIVVKVLGSGGSGGGSTGGSGGAGGGAGGYCEVKIVASALGSNVQVIVGASVIGSVGGVGRTGNYSGFGGYASCAGGGGGDQGQGANAPSQGGTGGVALLGDLNIQGGNGGAGITANTNFAMGGQGADSPYGVGGWPPLVGTGSTGVNGTNGSGYGSGGSGGARIGSGNSGGGAGAPGLVIVEEY